MAIDYLITCALLAGLFAIPAMISAYADNRAPRGPLIVFGLALAFLTTTVVVLPDTYSVARFPDVVIRVIADILH